jgi:tetratricopeptide (TPR) repeat protein
VSGNKILPSYSEDLVAKMVLIEAAPGAARRRVLREWASTARDHDAVVLFTDSHFEDGGPWAGVRDLFAPILEELRRERPELIDTHSYNLAFLFPQLRRERPIRNESLTELSAPVERTRNFAMDRGHRVVHGLIDLMTQWHGLQRESRLVLACDSLDRLGVIGIRFFTELLRRRGTALRLTMAVATDPGAQPREPMLRRFSPLIAWRAQLDLLPDPPTPVAQDEEERAAQELEGRAMSDPIELQETLPLLVNAWTRAGRDDRALLWRAVSLGVYNHQGFYEDARRFCSAVESGLDRILEKQWELPFWEVTRWNLVGNLFGCYIAVGETQKALHIVRDEALAKIDDPSDRPRVLYVMAMLHGRYLQPPDLTAAEDFLLEGLSVLASGAVPSPETYFLTTFLENGLAFIRYRQGRSEEAIELCRHGYQRLEEQLPGSAHALHKSVLLYNTAQVYNRLGLHEDAIRYYTDAIAMDPNYSEYYNERGSAHLQLGRFEEAVADYQRAIERSSPYSEVWINLGQVLNLMQRYAEAAEAFSTAIDIDPGHAMAFVGRAQSLEALGRTGEAAADYESALGLDSRQPLVWANLATLHFEGGEGERAVAELETAINLAPDVPDLHFNYAHALSSLGRTAAAAAALATYEELQPQAERNPAVLTG